MLTYESLIGEAKMRGMPVTKMRGILREYLQILILKEICRTESGRLLYLTGGTYLRLVHGLKRFSEDLDFNTDLLTPALFRTLLETVSHELKRIGISSDVEIEDHPSLLLGSLTFPTVEKAYGSVSAYSKKAGIIIKIQSNRPDWKIKKETEVVSGFGETYPCLVTEKGAFFADKIDALNKKARGRHLHDIIFMLTHKFPINTQVLSHLGIRKSYSEAILDGIHRFSKAELKKQAETLRPFLFDEQEADWLVRANELIPLFLEKYEREMKR